ncbi:MAG: hypothetical protein L3J67_09230 [Hyphomicrobiaceae bacterium]|nr:hypothetical protein [Hyphomicrobiaceae bacterium]
MAESDWEHWEQNFLIFEIVPGVPTGKIKMGTSALYRQAPKQEGFGTMFPVFPLFPLKTAMTRKKSRLKTGAR